MEKLYGRNGSETGSKEIKGMELKDNPGSDRGWDDDESNEASGVRKVFENSLNEIYWVESSLTRSLPDLIKYVSDRKLSDVLTDHLQLTYKHVARLNEIFAVLGKEVKERRNEVITYMLRESIALIQETDNGKGRDQAVIMATKKLEHYEIALYDTLYSCALLLEEKKVACMLNHNLEDNKQAALTLTSVAASYIDPDKLKE